MLYYYIAENTIQLDEFMHAAILAKFEIAQVDEFECSSVTPVHQLLVDYYEMQVCTDVNER